MNNLETARKILETRRDRNAWNKGVTLYALDLLELELNEKEDAERITPDLTRSQFTNILLHGAPNWGRYSESACVCALICDWDIAARLCTPSELKQTDNGHYNPSKDKTWYDVQALALAQAANRLYEAIFFQEV